MNSPETWLLMGVNQSGPVDEKTRRYIKEIASQLPEEAGAAERTLASVAPVEPPTSTLPLQPISPPEQAGRNRFEEMRKNLLRRLPIKTEEDKFSFDSRFDLTDSTVNMIDPEVYQQAYQTVVNLPEIRAAREGLDRYRNLVAMEMKHGTKQSADITPYLAQLHGWLTSRAGMAHVNPDGKLTVDQGISPAYIDKGDEVGARSKRNMDMLDDLQKREEGLADKINDYIKTMKGGVDVQRVIENYELNKLLSNKEPKIGGIKGLTPGQQDMAWERLWTSFQGQKAAGPAIQALAAIPTALVELENESSISDEMLKRHLLNLGGDTRPSDRDVSAFGGDRTLLERAKQAWNWVFGTGSFTPKNKEEIKKLIIGMSQVAVNRFQDLANGFARSVSRHYNAFRGIPTQDVLQFLYDRAGYTPENLPKITQSAKKITAKAKAEIEGERKTEKKGPMSFREFQEMKKREREKQKGGK